MALFALLTDAVGQQFKSVRSKKDLGASVQVVHHQGEAKGLRRLSDKV